MKRTYRHITIAVALALVAWVAVMPALAQDYGTENIFTELGAGSRGMSLGRSFVSLADDASALYWNPAALRNVQRTQFTVMYMSMGDFADVSYTYAGLVWPTLSAGAFGIGFQRVGTTFDSFDEQSRPTGEGDYSESQILIGYAAQRHHRWVFGTLAIGANFKIARQTVDPFSSTAPGVDVGLRWIPDAAPSLYLGLNLQDIAGASHKLDLATDDTYRTMMLGAGYTRSFDNGSSARFMLQYDSPERADGRFHLGAEYMFAKYVSLRAGYDDGQMTFGLGVGVSNYGLDYAFLSREEGSSSQAVAFNGGIGRSLEEQRADNARARALEEQELIRQAFESRVGSHRDAAKQLAAEGDYAGALDEWQIVLEFTPDDAEAVAGAAAAREAVVQQQAAATQDLANQAIIRTRFAQGLDFFNGGDYARARGEWLAILEVDSLHEGAQDYLARTQDKIDEQVRGHITRARQMENANRLTEAIAEWNNVQQYDPDNREARAAITRLRGRIESVSQDYQATQRRLKIVTLYDDALQQYNAGEYDAAKRNLDELLRLQPDHEDARRLQAMVKRKTTPLTDAEKQRIRELYLAGMQHFSKDEYAQAIEQWRKILDIDPTNESVQNNIREARERLERLEGKR